MNGYGIGKKLVAGVAQKSLAQGINRMSLQLPIKGENEARQFYLSLRFREGRNYLMYHNNLKKLSKQNPVILNPGDYACRTCKDLEVSFSTPWRISISNICDLCKDFSIV